MAITLNAASAIKKDFLEATSSHKMGFLKAAGVVVILPLYNFPLLLEIHSYCR
jgi:hypothetical protein